MDVLIKGMEMPTSCDKCDFGRLRYSFPWTYRKHGWSCQVDFYNNGEYTKLRVADYGKPVIANDCPLVPVPPHGRLIDADAFMQKIDGAKKLGINTIAYYLNDAPTIIEAEDGE